MFNKDKIRRCFDDKTLKIKSINKQGVIEYKCILDAFEHLTALKDIYKVTLANGENVTVTEDHSLYTFENNELKKIKPINKCEGLVFSSNNEVSLIDVDKVEKVDKRLNMYDLSVEDNENFVLTNGILVSNSFSPPDPAQEIAGFTETKRYRWPDQQLVNHLEDASNYVNLFPPATDYELLTYPRAWEPLMLLEAQVYALNDLAILWAGEEFNYALSGISLDLRRSDKFMSLANQIQSMVDKQLEMAKKRILCTVGLRQDRYTYSRGASMGPFTTGQNIKRWTGSRFNRIQIG